MDIARLIPLQELTGFAKRSLNVPPQFLGVVQKAKTLTVLNPGRHLVVNASDWLTGQVFGLECALLTSLPFILHLDVGLVYTSQSARLQLQAQVRVRDAALVFGKLLLPFGQLSLADLTQWVSAELQAQSIRFYNGVLPLQAQRLQDETWRVLEEILTSFGFSVQNLLVCQLEAQFPTSLADSPLSFTPIVSSVTQNDTSLQGMLAHLQGVELWTETLQDLAVKAGVTPDPAAVRQLASEFANQPQSSHSEQFRRIQQLFYSQQASAHLPAPLFRSLQNLLPQAPASSHKVTPIRHGIAVLKFVGALVTGLAFIFLAWQLVQSETPLHKLTGMLEVLLWAIPLISGTFWGLLQLESEQWRLAHPVAPEERLLRWVGGDLLQMEKNLRAQISRDLNEAGTCLDSAFRYFWKHALSDHAQQIRQVKTELEAVFQRVQADGAPVWLTPYLHGQNIPKDVLFQRLNAEQTLLRQASQLYAVCQRLQQASNAGRNPNPLSSRALYDVAELKRLWQARYRM